MSRRVNRLLLALALSLSLAPEASAGGLLQGAGGERGGAAPAIQAKLSCEINLNGQPVCPKACVWRSSRKPYGGNLGCEIDPDGHTLCGP